LSFEKELARSQHTPFQITIVAADVRRLILGSRKVRASLRRLLRFKEKNQQRISY